LDLDNNNLAKKAMSCYKEKRKEEGDKLLNEFLEMVKNSNQDHCSCTSNCKFHGNCIDCVIIHRGHTDHLPNCFYAMVNDKICQLSCLTEHSFYKENNK
jgi:hypothetical protein